MTDFPIIGRHITSRSTALAFFAPNVKSLLMKYLVVAAAGLLAICISTQAVARPHRGFHTGPYLAVEAGIGHNDFDRNQRTDEKVGTVIEPTLGFLFGWNLYDWFATEMSGYYSTSEKRGRREHVAGLNLNAKFFLITDSLINFKSLRILPFAQVGPALNIAFLPGDESSLNPDDTRTSIAFGPSVGGGVMFLFAKYVYLGLKAKGDFLYYEEIRQDIVAKGASTPSAVIYRGGFIPSFVTTVVVGVHF